MIRKTYTDTEWVQFARQLPTMTVEQLKVCYQNGSNECRQLVREEVARRTAQFAAI